MYKNKYLKYKQKYLQIKNQFGGDCNPEPTPDDKDPISLEHLNTLPPDEIITIPLNNNGIIINKCYKIKSIYEWLVRNPTDPESRIPFSPKNIADIKAAYEILSPSPLLSINNIRIEHGQFQNQNLTSVNIPNTVITIGNRAFKNNKLKSVTIPDNVTTIGTAAFQGNKLESINIPRSVRTIGLAAFASNKLISVIIPNTIETIGDSAFIFNKLIESVIIPRRFEPIINEIFDDDIDINIIHYI
jgi:hypothetical protein